MKKFINLLLLSILAFAFLGCNQPTGPSEEELQKQREEQEKLELEQRKLNRKKEIWKMIEGVWELKSNYYNNPSPIYEKVIIATDSFTIDGVQQSINLDTDATLSVDLDEDDIYVTIYTGYEDKIEKDTELIVSFKGVRINFSACYMEESDSLCICRYLWDETSSDGQNRALFKYVRAGSQDKEDEGDEGDSSGDNEGEATELDGTYSYSDSKYTGSITLSNGSWSYEGSKNNAAATSGSYSVNGSSITFNWNANGMDMSETFTITNSGSSSTWVSSETQISNFFMMLFGVIDLELELTKE